MKSGRPNAERACHVASGTVSTPKQEVQTMVPLAMWVLGVPVTVILLLLLLGIVHL